MNLKLRFFLFALFLCQGCWAQVLKVNYLDDSLSCKPAIIGSALLIAEEEGDTAYVKGLHFGPLILSDLDPKRYKLIINQNFPGIRPSIQYVRLAIGDTTYLDVFSDLCGAKYPIKACPKSHLKCNVIRVNYGIVVHYNFEDEAHFNRFAKRIAKQGYQTLHSGDKEVLIHLHDKELHKMLENTDLCDEYLFCKRHKIIFR